MHGRRSDCYMSDDGENSRHEDHGADDQLGRVNPWTRWSSMVAGSNQTRR